MGRALRKIALAVALVFASTGLTLGGLELGFRLFKPQRYMALSVNTWDPAVGTRHIPGARGFVLCPEYKTDVRINSRGLRDREYPYEKPAAVSRILCLGDSFTFGYGVEAEDTYPKVLERRLADDPARRWEVLNAGVGSTGTAHHLARFEAEDHRYSPDLVVLAFCPANDFWDDTTSGLYTLEGGGLVRHEARMDAHAKVERAVAWIPGYRTVFARSHLLNYVKFRVARHHFRQLGEDLASPVGDPQAAARSEDLTRRLVLALRDSVASSEGRLLVMMVPCATQRDRTARLVRALTEAGVPVLDLDPVFAEGARSGLRTNYPQDHHWTREGHELAATALRQFLLELPVQ